MFLKIVINDFFILKPRELGSKENSVLKKKIYDKYLQKILENEGICVGVADFDVVECFVLQSLGDVKFKVNVSLIIFRIFENEMLVGTIKENTSNGILVQVADFVNVFIPGHLLNYHSFYDEEEKVWTWIGEETPKFYFDNGKQIRFKGHKSLLTKTKELNLNLVDIEENRNQYFFTGKCNEDGLGPLMGWNPNA